MAFDIHKIRGDFPALAGSMNGKPLIYLDNAATTQKPRAMIERMSRFYSAEYATVSRGVYALSQTATQFCEQARNACREFLNAASRDEIVFTRGTTEGINLVAAAYGRMVVGAGDEVIISEIEHHANIVPWKRLCEEKNAVLRVIPADDRGELKLEEYKKMLNSRTRVVAVTQVSNSLGTINLVKEMAVFAHAAGAVFLVDGAQSAPHMKIDVRDLDCDFYVFSAHKVYGPTGLGILYGKKELLEKMPPYQGGGEMIRSVSFEEITYTVPPHKFEAGTVAIAEIIAFAATLEYLRGIGLEDIEKQEAKLARLAEKELAKISGLRVIGTARHKGALFSFVMDGIHAHDVGTILDREGIAVRTGHHCAQPVMKHFNVPATTRASFSFYNTEEEVLRLAEGLEKVKSIFA